ncbi:replication-relaxation family protein [Aquibacillus sp. 3ASR75-11]|uniref:Replication-relaxation family protein n=1 Tax=Terrihalobacillus insolitus TaxID=2950438 RepID=A0A9X3WR87_9BACI|nr:replication-relaxation family protein [Terrihalobacillus insolitus]MDC3424295.1 replication-relaxation family protein [Terrihalobacillus insolitus]
MQKGREKKILRVKTGPNGQGLWLAEFELNLLKLIATQRILESTQITKYHNLFQPASQETVKSKLYKWKEKGIIMTYTIKKKFGNPPKIVRITNKGVSLLVENNYLPSYWENINVSGFTDGYTSEHSTNQRDHNAGIKEMVITALANHTLYFRKLDIEEPLIDSYSPRAYEYNELKGNIDKDTERLLPDWVLKKGNRLLYIESDTASEGLSQIKGKLDRYMEIARKEPDKEHIVMIGILDDSISTEKIYPKNRKIRSYNIKNLLIGKERISNLSVFATSLGRTSKANLNILLGNKPFTNDGIELEVDTAIDALEHSNEHFDCKFETLDNSSVYTSKVPKEMYADRAVALTNRAGSLTKNVLFLLMDEGNAASVDRLHFLSHLNKDGGYKRKIDKIIAFYPKEEEFENDAVADNYDFVLWGSTENWLNNIETEPIFYQSPPEKPFTREVTTFERSFN